MESLQTLSFDSHSRTCALDGRSQLFEAVQGALAVLAGSKIVDNRGALGDGTNHCQAVADGFVAGYDDSSLESQRWGDLQTLGMSRHWTEVSMVIDF